MELAAKMDEWGKPAWIAAMVLGFILFWPIGLAILAFMIWSGRMSCGRHGNFGRWHNTRGDLRARWKARGSSGNAAFDEYRNETLRRLEDEQREFQDFLERLRHAKDKQEFDQFMDERRKQPKDGEAPGNAPGDPAPQPQG